MQENWNRHSYFWFAFIIICVLAIIGGCFCGLAPSSNFNDSMFLVGFILLMIGAAILIWIIGYALYLKYDFYNTRRIRAEYERGQIERERISNAINNIDLNMKN